MSTTISEPVVSSTQQCSVCNGASLLPLIDLPTLPLTGLFSSVRGDVDTFGIDQQFLWCEHCGHGQLKHHVSSEVLYGQHYTFRTSFTSTARDGVQHLVSFFHDLVGASRFRTLVDVGCNDLYLIRMLAPLVERCVGIDPMWIEDNGSLLDQHIQVLGTCIENVPDDVLAELAPDLIVCRHVLEHLSDPVSVLRKLVRSASPGALFLLEVPELTLLLARGRFDQIFHEHVQYFTLSSLLNMIHHVGGDYCGHRENFHHWGSVMVAFRKRTGCTHADEPFGERKSSWTPQAILKAYALFKQQMQITRDVIERQSEFFPFFGYGASPMLPVLAYHLEMDLSRLRAVVDDDNAKQGLSYMNLPLSICSPGDVSWQESTILITAPESGRELLRRSFQRGARQVVYPLLCMS